MSLIVQKFGGTSVGDINRIKNVAQKIKREVENGNKVAVVVSAMSGVTNQLVSYCDSITTLYDAREYDAIVSSGEQVSSGLLALALQEVGIPARSFLGWQIPIITDDAFGKARIDDIKSDILNKVIADGIVPVVSGFQGVTKDNRITTLGRGGSDTSAVALAVALNADRCDIYTDVDGVYSADPRIVSKAKLLKRVSYEEMLEMASLGSKVLQTRSVEFAMKYGVCLRVLSSFQGGEGTIVCDEEEIVEKEIISGVTYSRNEAKITLVGVEDKPGVSANIFGKLSNANISVDMIVQNISEDGKTTDLTFTVEKTDFERALNVLNDAENGIVYSRLISDKEVVKVSVIGVGMKSHVGVASTMFKALADQGINIEVISKSEIKISVLIAEKFTELALRSLHTAYNMDA
ncbi:MAG: aspartate kinase [Alphaproteobacteria bacterium]